LSVTTPSAATPPTVPGWKLGVHGNPYLQSHPVTTGNQVELLVGQSEWTPRLLADLEAERNVININQYNWEPNGPGSVIADLLRRKVREGVEVNITLDAHGSLSKYGSGVPKHEVEAFIDGMRRDGINVTVYEPDFTINPFRKPLDHRKIVQLTNVAYLSGMGFADKYHDWVDLSVRLEGPAAAQVGAEYIARAKDLGLDASARQKAQLSEMFSAPIRDAGAAVRILANTPSEKRFDVTDDFHASAKAATKRFWVMTPYIGHSSVIDTLNETAKRGIDVRVLVPGPESGRNGISVALSRTFLRDLDPRVKVFELPEMLHAKAWLRDDDVLTIGSTNLSHGSLRFYRELSASVQDAGAGAKYAAHFEDVQSRAIPVTDARIGSWKVTALTLLRKALRITF
jgi:phosphatidylserine/phosphatidylglycerophosphate/cardiolipin synthase-like enzyme